MIHKPIGNEEGPRVSLGIDPGSPSRRYTRAIKRLIYEKVKHLTYSIVGVVVTWIVASHYFDPPRVRFPDNAIFVCIE